MIVYFSATGNSKHVAHKIAMEIDDWARPIEELKLEKHVEARAGGVCGIVCPTYFCGIPVIMEEFLKKVKMFVGEDCYFFFVSTYGGNSGMSAVFSLVMMVMVMMVLVVSSVRNGISILII